MDQATCLWGVLSLFLFLTGASGQPDVCGSAPLNAKTKIVGGEDAIPGSWPWQCSLLRFGSHFCGGSLINDQWVLTVAHCFSSTNTGGLTVALGRDTQQLSNPNEVTRTVTRIICHPSYNEGTNDNDICLLKLSRSVSFDSYIRPVCLAGTGNAPSAGTNVWVTGWGTINSGQDLPFPQRLQEVNVPVVSRLVCDVSYTNVDITNNMLCAGRAGKDSCQVSPCLHLWSSADPRLDDGGRCNIEVLDTISYRDFMERFAYSRPVILRGLTDNTRFQRLCSKINLLKEYGDRSVRLSTANTYSYRKVDVSFREYVELLLRPQTLDALGNGAGTGVPFHWHGPGYSEVIYGRKRWFLYPPDKPPHFHPNISTLSWVTHTYPSLSPEEAPLECTIQPGEVLFFPDRWWHATLNLDTSVFISTFLG
ncbi:hypothetical protein NQD34_005933 [Periophthalmus magnuspinnatus]|nr:hypothetical protein NQD34_005933 [Periophthalmus magnuspinnatus]